jgi:hypothetical protein
VQAAVPLRQTLLTAIPTGRMAESRVTEEQALASVKLALELGIDVNATNDASDTTLHGAASIKSEALVQLDNGVRIDVGEQTWSDSDGNRRHRSRRKRDSQQPGPAREICCEHWGQLNRT